MVRHSKYTKPTWLGLGTNTTRVGLDKNIHGYVYTTQRLGKVMT